MTDSPYIMDNNWVNERERLAALERNLDPGTIYALTEIGVLNGWNCLEIGAGGGSITEWLCNQVGPEGKVTATDMNTRFIDVLDYENLEVRKHNVVTEDLPTGKYDLVHARFLLAHIPERETVLVKMSQALRPGGWILVEEPDFCTEEADPIGEPSKRQLFETGMAAIRKFLHQRGMERHYGRTLFSRLKSLDLTMVRANGRCLTMQGGTPESKEMTLTMDQLQSPAIATGLITEQEYQDFRSLFDDENFCWRLYLMTSAWGQKPRLS